jgi:hypothetical protein
VTTSAASGISYVTYATGVPSAAGTGGNFSVPVLSPTKSMSVPVTLSSTFVNTASRSASATVETVDAAATGGADSVVVNAAALVVAGLVGVFAF